MINKDINSMTKYIGTSDFMFYVRENAREEAQ